MPYSVILFTNQLTHSLTIMTTTTETLKSLPLKSLPTLLSTKDLKALLATIPAPAVIRMGDMTATVKVNDVKILSAIKSPHRAQWHVMAREGLITYATGLVSIA